MAVDPSSLLSFDDFRGLVLGLYRPPMRAPATRAKIRSALDDFATAVDARVASDLDTVNVGRFVAGRAGCNPNTTRSKLRALRAAANLGVAEGWLAKGPSWARVMPRAAPARRVDLDHGQVVRLLASLRERAGQSWSDGRLYALAMVVAHTGIRKSEALHLKPEDVDAGRRFLWVSARRRLKTEASAAPVPAPPALAEALGWWLPRCGPDWVFPGARRAGPWTGGAPGQRALDRLKAAGEIAGVPGVTFQGLRHTLGKLMVGRWGLSLDQARSVLRHSSAATTEAHYLHRDDLACLAAIGSSVDYRAG